MTSNFSSHKSLNWLIYFSGPFSVISAFLFTSYNYWDSKKSRSFFSESALISSEKFQQKFRFSEIYDTLEIRERNIADILSESHHIRGLITNTFIASGREKTFFSLSQVKASRTIQY